MSTLTTLLSSIIQALENTPASPDATEVTFEVTIRLKGKPALGSGLPPDEILYAPLDSLGLDMVSTSLGTVASLCRRPLSFARGQPGVGEKGLNHIVDTLGRHRLGLGFKIPLGSNEIATLRRLELQDIIYGDRHTWQERTTDPLAKKRLPEITRAELSDDHIRRLTDELGGEEIPDKIFKQAT
jgi:hypothetical protein